MEEYMLHILTIRSRFDAISTDDSLKHEYCAFHSRKKKKSNREKMSTLNCNKGTPQLISGTHCMKRKCGLELTFQNNYEKFVYKCDKSGK